MEKKEIRIVDKEGLLDLYKNHKTRVFPSPHPQIVLELEELDTDKKNSLSRKMNSYYYSCGCSPGAFMMLLAAIGIPILYFIVFKARFHLAYILLYFLLVFISTTIGKTTGMVIDRFRFKQLVNEVLKY